MTIIRTPFRLYQRGRFVQASLRNSEIVLEPIFEVGEGEPALEPAQIAERLEPELTELGRLVNARHAEGGQTVDVQSRWRQELADFDRNVRAAVRMLKGMFRLAGREDLAARLRPTFRRTVRRLGKAEVAEATEATEPPSETSEAP